MKRSRLTDKVDLSKVSEQEDFDSLRRRQVASLVGRVNEYLSDPLWLVHHHVLVLLLVIHFSVL